MMRYSIMLICIMLFLDRKDELARLDGLLRAREGGLAVVYGRRRIGKTRLLVEWCARHGGVYAVADQSTADVQRRYLAATLAARLPGFGDVDYRDWRGLFARLANEARVRSWRGPIVFDELPYWTASSPELPSVLQHWIDHEAREAKLVVAVAGSSQRMMQGLVLDRTAPLYGRAREIFDVTPLEVSFVTGAIGRVAPREILEFYAAWGGVPRYWELASELASTRGAIHDLVLDPRGVLHREPDRLLLEEVPSAMEVRPLLDAIGGGVHRVSEIAGRMGRAASSLPRPLERLVELGLAAREVPFGESPKKSKRSLYRIADPFTRLWFRVVAPHRAELVSGTRKSRLTVLSRYWEHLVSSTWEDLCRLRLPHVAHRALGGGWKPASRWWRRNAPEWDVVAEDVAHKRILFGEAKLSYKDISAAARALAARTPPELPASFRGREIVRALFVPQATRITRSGDVAVVTLRHLLG